jgi:hypothetical protein
MTELSKKFSEEWAALPSDQKQVYVDKAAAEKKIADEKIAAYLAANPEAAAAVASGLKVFVFLVWMTLGF